MGKRRRRLISIPLLSSFSLLPKGFVRPTGVIWRRRRRSKGEQPWHFPPFLRFLRTKKDKKEGSSKPLDLRHHSICHTSFFSPFHPRGCGGQKWRKFGTQQGGGRAICGTKEADSPNMEKKDRFFSAFSRRISLLATNWPSREEALLLLLPFSSPCQTPSFPPFFLSFFHPWEKREEGASRMEKELSFKGRGFSKVEKKTRKSYKKASQLRSVISFLQQIKHV